ncbi:probable disease resistance protein At1g61190 [Typha latifolia]|uniref:probable disease resistance protein At1g61190 n=1 Tax=Typha latifolia TaxID=4733 RepID=UPI003C2E5669
MRNAMEVLNAGKRDTENTIEDGRRTGERPTERVILWLQRVIDIDANVSEVANIYEQRGCRLIRDCSLNCWSSYKISRKATKLLAAVVELTMEREAFTAVLTHLPPESILELCMPSLLMKTSSIESHIEMVRGYLSDDNIGIVGIWGMGGVGKTTLLKLINNSLLGERNLGFDHVIWVSSDDTIENLQHNMLSKLGLLGVKDSISDDRTIYTFLQDKNFLLLIDGFPKYGMFSNIGIPTFHMGVPGAKYKQKVVFTTRSESLCAQMSSNKIIKVETLREDEAMFLFKEIVSADVINSDPRMSRLVEKVVKECDGLPLALVAIGRALSGKKTFQQWECVVDSLRKLKLHFVPDMENRILPTLKLSYDNLQDDTHRECFLSCCLWPRDQYIPINDLIECWMGLGLINEFNEIHEAYNQGHSIIGDLKDASLMEPDLADENDYVKLHSVLWDLARWISSDCGKSWNKWLLSTTIDALRWAVTDWELAVRVSIINSKIGSPPEEIAHCRNLSTLNLKGNLHMEIIPDGIFQIMVGLIYLDLSYTMINQLPGDIGCLVALQHLNLSHTQISSFPWELLVVMTKLKYLLLRGIKNLSFPSDNFLSSLEVLDTSPFVEVPPHIWRSMRRNLKSISMAIKSRSSLGTIFDRFVERKMRRIRLDEIGELTVLEFEQLSRAQPLLEVLEVYSCPTLETLEIYHSRDADEPELFRLEKLRLWSLAKLYEIVWSGVLPSVFFPSLRILEIEKCHGLVNISWVLQLPLLMKLQVVDCLGMKEVIDEITVEKIEVDEMNSAFPRVRELYLVNLPLLGNICKRQLTFPSLESVVVLQCPELRQLPFHSQMVNNSKLKCIGGNNKWLKHLVWENEDTKSYFRYYFRERRTI